MSHSTTCYDIYNDPCGNSMPRCGISLWFFSYQFESVLLLREHTVLYSCRWHLLIVAGLDSEDFSPKRCFSRSLAPLPLLSSNVLESFPLKTSFKNLLLLTSSQLKPTLSILLITCLFLPLPIPTLLASKNPALFSSQKSQLLWPPDQSTIDLFRLGTTFLNRSEISVVVSLNFELNSAPLYFTPVSKITIWPQLNLKKQYS